MMALVLCLDVGRSKITFLLEGKVREKEMLMLGDRESYIGNGGCVVIRVLC